MNSLWSIVIRKASLLSMHDVKYVSDLYTKKYKERCIKYLSLFLFLHIQILFYFGFDVGKFSAFGCNKTSQTRSKIYLLVLCRDTRKMVLSSMT